MTTNTDDLTATVHSALIALDPVRKAEFLLDTALALINAGKYGDDVERYLDVYLKTPNLPKPSIAKALLARANARKACGDRLLTQAHQDFQAVLRLDPSNRDVQNHIRRRTQIRFSHDPASHRAPPEVWSRIANYIPRYHLRTWLFLSTFHRSIALHHIFHTIDLYFGEDQPENVNRSLDIFDRVKQDKSFANLVRCLRVHWAYEEGELLDLMVRVFRTALPEFSALREFEWIGYPELRVDMVQSLLASHPKLTSLGSIGFHFDACGISAFKSLRKLTLRAEDDDGYADWSEITTVLNNNVGALRHLTLGAYLHRQHSWDATFLSPAIHNLTHLDLVDTRISHTVLSRIAHAVGGVGGRLESLTLHGILEDPGKAAVVFGSDEIINGEHTFLPRLKSFRFLLVGQPQVVTPPPPSHPPQPSSQLPYTYHPYPQIPHQQQQQQPPHPQDHYDPTILHLYQTITHFLRGRTALRRLDLGSCPWDLVSPVLPGLKGLRVLGVRIGCLVKGCSTGITASGGGIGGGGGGISNGVECTSELDVLVKNLPSQIGTLRVEVGVSELPLHVYANLFQKFPSLSFLHLQLHTAQLVQHPPLGVQVGGVQQYHHQAYNAQPHFYPYQQGLQGHAGPSTPQQYTHNNNNLQQPQPTRVQPSYHPFPPHPAHTTAGVSPGTPKRRNNGPNTAGKRDGGGGGGGGGGEHEGEGDDSNVNTMNASNTGEGGNSTSGSGGGGGGSSSQAQGGTSSAHHHHHQASASATGGRQPSMGPPPPPPQSQQHGHGYGHGHGQLPVANFPQHGPPGQQPHHHHPFHHGPAHSPHLPLTPPQQQHPPLQPLDTLESAKHVAGAVPSLDFVGWNGELYVIVRNNASSNSNNIAAVKANTNSRGGDDSVVIKVDDTSIGGEGGGIGPSRASAGPADGAGSTTAAAPTTTSNSTTTAAGASTNASVVPDTPNSNAGGGGGPSRNPTPSTPHSLVAHSTPTQPPSSTTTPITTPVVIPLMVELKELPSRRRLDCGNGVDLGSEDAAWLERKDVPMDYDMPVTGVDGAAV